MRSPLVRLTALILLPALLAVGGLYAQETRGTFTGWVKDVTGGVVPGAEVEAIHLATGVRTATVTNDTGNYRIPYLSSGIYSISATLPGFRQFLRERVELRLGDTLTLNITLEVGEVSETVVVSGQAPLFDKTSASLSVVVDTRKLEELPIREGTVAELATLAPGVVYNTHIRLAKPGMTGGISSLATDGQGTNKNEFSIDGVPNVAENTIAYSPPAAAIAEFRVATTSYDASVGHALGGMMDMVTKSGTNDYKGMLQLVERNSAFDAWSSFAKSAGTPKYVYQDHHAVGAIGGPVRLPKIYDGTNRTFFFAVFDYNKYGNPFPNTISVPTAEMREGDFSRLLTLGNPANYQLYDPATTRFEGGKYVRDPIPNNIIPQDRISPIAKKLASYWPLPNLDRPDGTNNFQVRDAMEHQRYKTFTTRLDHVFSERHRTYGRFSVDRWNVKQMNRFEGLGSGVDMSSRNTQLGLDHVYTIRPTVVLNAKLGFQRKRRWEDQLYAGQWSKDDWKDLGFSDRLIAMIPERSVYFPRVTFNDGTTEFGWAGWSGAVPYDGAAETITSAGHISWVKGNHNLNFGGDYRSYRRNFGSWLGEQPLFRFENTYTRRDNTAPAPTARGALAAFMMGYHNYATMGLTDSFAAQQPWAAWYIQDNWRVTRRLTLNVGLRHELESGVKERYDRMINGFDLATSLPIEAAVRARYAANPFPEVPAEQLRVRGGYLFASGSNRSLWQRDNRNLMPRLGLAYMIDDKTVVNAGYGMYFDNLGVIAVSPRQPGFSRTTRVDSTNDNGVNWVTTWADPIREPLLQPIGASLGLMTDIDGGGKTFERNFAKNPYSQRWSFGFQRELPLDAIVRATYLGSRSLRLMATRNYNAVPNEHLSTLPVRDQAKINWMNAQVPNPFRGVEGVTSGLATNANMSRSQLLRPYPHFGDVNLAEPSGFSTYNAFQLDFDRRFSDGFSVGGAYTFSKTLEATSFLNAGDDRPFYQVGGADRSHIYNLHSILHLPFGRGRWLGSDWSGVVNHLLGGWQIGTLLRVQSGAPVAFGQFVLKEGKSLNDILLPSNERDILHYFKNYNYYLRINQGDAAKATAQMNAEYPFELNSAINGLAWNVRTIPDRHSSIRGPGYILLDTNLKKEIRFGETKSFDVRLDASNVLNRCNYLALNTTWSQPQNFGRITSPNGYPRQFQIWLTFKF
jgi:hypothetical protein